MTAQGNRGQLTYSKWAMARSVLQSLSFSQSAMFISFESSILLPQTVWLYLSLSPLIQTLQPRKHCLNCLSTNKSTPATTMSTSKLTDLPLFPLHLFLSLSISLGLALSPSLSTELISGCNASSVLYIGS